MKTALHTRLICGWLAVLVLLSSTGVGIVDHWCKLRGKSQHLMVSSFKSCSTDCSSDRPLTASSSGKPEFHKTPCCKESLRHVHVDVSRTAVHDGAQTPGPTLQWVEAGEFAFFLAATVVRPTASPLLLPSGPPLSRSGRFLLTSLCTWLI